MYPSGGSLNPEVTVSFQWKLEAQAAAGRGKWFHSIKCMENGVMASQPTPPGHVTPPRNKGLIAGLIKGNQWLISPDHKAGYGPGGVG